MNRKYTKSLLAFFVAVGIYFSLASTSFAAYQTSGSFTSTNLLIGATVGSIDSFVYSLSAKPDGTDATVQFSQNSTNWYNSLGTADSMDTLTTGINNTIDLSGLNWGGSNFYYKITFSSDGTDTPVLDNVTLNYNTTLTAPTVGVPIADSTTQISWVFTDNSTAESGFKVYDTENNLKVICDTVNITSCPEPSLSPNTQYTRKIAAYNSFVSSAYSANSSIYTLPLPPDITATKPTRANIIDTDTITFSSIPNFGAGGVEYYRYSWDTSGTHLWSGSEPIWSQETLAQTVTTIGNYFLHLQSFNNDDVANSTTLDFGPLQFPGFRLKNIGQGKSVVLTTTGDDVSTNEDNFQIGNKSVIVKKGNDNLVKITVNFSTDRDMGNMIGDSDSVEKKSFVDLSGVAGIIGTHTLYIPGTSAARKVRICPNAVALDLVTTTCSGGYELADGESNGGVIANFSNNFWVVSGLTGTGGMEITEAIPVPVNSNTTSSNPGSNNNSTPVCSNSRPLFTPDLFQIDTTSTEVKLFFTPMPDTSDFYISFSENQNAEEHGESVSLIREGVQSHTVYHIKPNTTYYFKVRGQNGCMPGEWSNIMKARTNSKSIVRLTKFYKYPPAKINITKSTVSRLAAKITKATEEIIKPLANPTETPLIYPLSEPSNHSPVFEPESSTQAPLVVDVPKPTFWQKIINLFIRK